MELHYDTCKSPIGVIYIVFGSTGIVRLCLTKEKFGKGYNSCKKGKNEEVRKQLQKYFSGRQKKFSLPICLNGSSFQKKVWNALRSIPYGETRSYEWLAKKIGRTKAVRAVGNAVGTNPLPIIIPCHRVIRKNGELGGYGYGPKMKEKLLEHERRHKN
ncbi:MAG: methylated-DNA--[protein]-cysteine S-methyltransferase [Candidatus Thermoplasmatota archaeon]|nr:methylated-DNA--[protein]-cysteine S-methyltransferase [Candidatus Thermoplasmatota archaeon]